MIADGRRDRLTAGIVKGIRLSRAVLLTKPA